MLPFLLGDRIVARVDLKSDRAAATLRVQAAHAEPGIAPHAILEPLAAELRLMAAWLGLQRIKVERAGDLAPSRSARAFKPIGCHPGPCLHPRRPVWPGSSDQRAPGAS